MKVDSCNMQSTLTLDSSSSTMETTTKHNLCLSEPMSVELVHSCTHKNLLESNGSELKLLRLDI